MPWYTTAKIYSQKFWEWCKKYWKFIVGALIPVGLWLITKIYSRKEASEQVLENTNNAHRDEVRVIEASHAIETQGVQTAEDKHDKLVAQIKAEHAAAEIQLDSEKEARVKQIVREHGDNPDEITRRISALTGIRVVRRN